MSSRCSARAIRGSGPRRWGPISERLAVRNLLDNALEYTPSGGTVTITTRAADDEGIVAVADTGIGIPSRYISRIFERFDRVDDARNRGTGGTRLGLAIVRHVAEMHRGAVEVGSELGTGSKFTMRIPRHRGV